MRSLFSLMLLTAFLAQLGDTLSVAQEPTRLPLCPSGEVAPIPNYAPLGARPKVSLWADLEGRALSNCAAPSEAPARLVVAIAARFSFSGGIDDLAGRVGAISKMEGLHYWSTTEKRWRELIESASALKGASDWTPRSDFLAREVLSGRGLYFSQDDSRSTGQPIYRMSVREWSRSHLILDVENVTAIKFGFVTLFAAQDLQAVHFINRLADKEWGYYALSLVRSTSAVDQGTSLINRMDAYYRFLAGISYAGLKPLAN
jgi:hypothetical protein